MKGINILLIWQNSIVEYIIIIIITDIQIYIKRYTNLCKEMLKII